jgi:hypothetical protein
MVSGGARVNSGPAPDPNALRRDRERGLDKDGWLTLPAGGYTGPIPAWPLLADIGLRAKLDVQRATLARLEDEYAEAPVERQTALNRRMETVQEKIAVLSFQVAEQEQRELDLWVELWKSSQAHAWVAKVGSGGLRDVAQYVRHKVLAELGSMEDAKEARQWSDRLGLNPSAMLRNRWRIAPDQVAEKRTTKVEPVGSRTSARDRLKAVNGGDA